MNAPRLVRPLGLEPEDKLVALLEAMEGRLTRAQIWTRVDSDFPEEGDLAKALGPLVASGRLVREKRQGPRGEEFVYGVPGRVDAIAQAVEKVKAAAPAPAPITPKPEEPAMSKKIDAKRQKIRDYFTPEQGFASPSRAAKDLDMRVPALSYYLKEMLDAGELAVIGMNRMRQYGHPKAKPVAMSEATSPAPEKAAKPEKASGRKRSTPRAAAAALLPVPAPQPTAEGGGIAAWAIDDKGTVAINQGANRVVLTREQIAYGVQFLELSQHIWKGAR